MTASDSPTDHKPPALTRPLRVCQVCYSRGTGGLERHVLDLCAGLAQRHEVTLVGDESFRPLLDPRVTLAPIEIAVSRINPLRRRRLRLTLEAARPDVVHAQASKAAALVGPIRGPWRRVATVHGLKRWTWMFRRYDRVIAVSAAAAQLLGRIPSHVVRNGIDPPEPPPRPCGRDWLRSEMGLGLSPARPVVIAIGRLAPVKGFDVLLRAWRSIDADLALVGDGPERAALEALAASLGLTPRVRFLGLRHDVPRLLCACDLMVISSRREGLPYVLLEALHLARPVVATHTPGVAELLPVEALCPPDDPAALARVIQHALDDLPQALLRMAPAWALARRELTREAMVRGVEAVYSELFTAGAAPR